MLTRRIDAALSALADCRDRVPELRDLYRPGSAERTILDELLRIVGRTREVLLHPAGRPSAD
jgi:hypothetical protein